MTVTSLGKAQSDTIMSGVVYFLMHGMWPLAVIVFIASIFVPMLKLAILIFLLISVQRGSRWRPVERTRLYRLTEAIGRWSMVDIFVVTILVALVRLGNLATIEAGAGRRLLRRGGRAHDAGRRVLRPAPDLGPQRREEHMSEQRTAAPSQLGASPTRSSRRAGGPRSSG